MMLLVGKVAATDMDSFPYSFSIWATETSETTELSHILLVCFCF